MRKHGTLITVISAILLVVLCIGTLTFSDKLIEDYQNTVEKISLSANPSMLIVNNSEAALVYPWDVYESAKKSSTIQAVDTSKYYDTITDEQVCRTINIFSPWLLDGYEKVEWQKHLQYTDDGNTRIFYIKDVKIIDNLGDTYLINIAFSGEQIPLYYACDRMGAEKIDSDRMSLAYEKLNSDYSAFRDEVSSRNNLNDTDALYTDPAVAAESDDSTCFDLFLQKLDEFGYTPEVESIIWDTNSAGIIYRHSDSTPNTVNVGFSQGDIELVLFFDLDMCSFTGFSSNTYV